MSCCGVKNPTDNPTDQSDTTGQVFLRIRMNPTSPDHSDRLQPPHNPSVVGLIPTGPTNPPDYVVILVKRMAMRDVATGQQR